MQRVRPSAGARRRPMGAATRSSISLSGQLVASSATAARCLAETAARPTKGRPGPGTATHAERARTEREPSSSGSPRTNKSRPVSSHDLK